jgi:translation initiation factor IF-2
MVRSFTKVRHYLHFRACLAAKLLSLGRLDTFRHLKDDITEASKGTECGINLESFGDLKQDDVIQVYSDIELPKVL